MNCSIRQYFIPAEGRLNAVSPSTVCSFISQELGVVRTFGSRRYGFLLALVSAVGLATAVGLPSHKEVGCVCLCVYEGGERKKSRGEKGRHMGTGDL